MFSHNYIYPFELDLERFFYENKKELESLYPGIHLKKLLQEFESIEVDGNQSFTTFKDQLIQGVPLEYISNRSYFYSGEFQVSPDVLIPRSETEILVERAVTLLNEHSQFTSVLDVGCGSGVIGLTIAEQIQRPLSVLLTDISDKALKIAKRNFWEHRYRMNPEHIVDFLQSDLLDRVESTFDLIVSNPPYIKWEGDRDGVHQQVMSYEPHQALFLKDDEYHLWFQRFFKQIEKALCPNGFFLMEGHEDHLESLANSLSSLKFCDIEILKDYTHRPRFLIGKKAPQGVL